MTDISITPANVLSSPGSKVSHGSAGAAVSAGQVVYKDPADGKYKLADNNAVTAAVRKAAAIALHAAAVNQPLAVHEAGPITIGAVLTPGVTYYLSDTPGGICPVADLASGEYPTILGMATSASVLDVDFQTAGVAL